MAAPPLLSNSGDTSRPLPESGEYRRLGSRQPAFASHLPHLFNPENSRSPNFVFPLFDQAELRQHAAIDAAGVSESQPDSSRRFCSADSAAAPLAASSGSPRATVIAAVPYPMPNSPRLS